MAIEIKPMCKHHKPRKLGYVEFMFWAGKMAKRGCVQKRCPVCRRYFFKSEMGIPPKAKRTLIQQDKENNNRKGKQ